MTLAPELLTRIDDYDRGYGDNRTQLGAKSKMQDQPAVDSSQDSDIIRSQPDFLVLYRESPIIFSRDCCG